MGFGDKKEAWEESVNMKPDEIGTVRTALLVADRDDHLMPYCKDYLAQSNDVKSELFILQDGPVVKDGARYERWLYYKAWESNAIRGYYIYDTGEGNTPDVR